MDKHNKTKHPSFRRAYRRLLLVLGIPTGVFYLAFDLALIRDPENFSLVRNLVYLVGLVSPLLLVAWAYAIDRLNKLRISLRGDAVPPKSASRPS